MIRSVFILPAVLNPGPRTLTIKKDINIEIYILIVILIFI